MKTNYSKKILGSAFLWFGMGAMVFAQGTPLITKDKIGGYVGELQGPTTFSASTDSASGKPGDYAVDFTTSGGGVLMTNADFLNVAASNDVISIAFWAKKYDIANGSAFWGVSPSSSGGGRGIQAHLPWSNDNIFFDTAGCCTAPNQRLNDTIANFPGYTGDDSWWQEWHHFTFVKNKDEKQVWIDGQMFLDGTGADPLPTDFTQMWLGNDVPDSALMHGLMDDFAVYSTALSSDHIAQLFSGTSPTNLTGETLLAYWDFNDPPVIGSPKGDPLGFTLAVNDVGGNVIDTNTISLTFDGTSVSPTSVSKSGSTTVIGFTAPNGPLASGSSHTTHLAVKDTNGQDYEADGAFTVETYQTLSADAALPDGSVDTSKVGFKIKTYQVDSVEPNGIANAEEILAGNKGPNVADQGAAGGVGSDGFYLWPGVINFDVEIGGQNGHFNDPDYPDADFPGIPGFPITNLITENFACELDTALQFPQPGFYTMVVNSDDDFRTTSGQNPLDIFLGQRLGEFNAPGGRGSSDTAFKFYIEKAGIYPFRTIYEQGQGGGNLEWFMINNDGTRVLINDTTNAIKAYQWVPSVTTAYVKSVVPDIGAADADPDLVKAVIVPGSTPLDSSKISLKIDDTAVNATVSQDSGNTVVSYVPSPIFAALSSHKATLEYSDGGNSVSRDWQFTVAPYTKDTVNGYVGVLGGSTVFTPDAGGHTGQPGDHAIDFGTSGGTSVHIADASWLNTAAAADTMTFSVWIKKHDNANSSAFWANSPSSSGSSRGWQAHTPWGGVVYFDTAGCCTTDTQRLSGPITDFPAFTGDDSWWTNNWHLFVFVKNAGEKQVWIDGQMFLDGTGADPLPTDFTDLYFGAGPDGSQNNMHGLEDDFAIYATALSEADIGKLNSGTSPTDLGASTKLLAYWNFNDAPAAPSAPTLSIARDGANVTITWTGTLQSADSVTGPWSDVQNETSPASLPASSGQKFYRAQQ